MLFFNTMADKHSSAGFYLSSLIEVIVGIPSSYLLLLYKQLHIMTVKVHDFFIHVHFVLIR